MLAADGPGVSGEVWWSPWGRLLEEIRLWAPDRPRHRLWG
jgi:hypothetical protein